MKRSLVALAILGAFAGAASAQSSVTVYGIVDLGIAKQNSGTSWLQGGTGSVGAAGNKWTVQQAYASRLGFRGIEDLGGGLRAAFNLEHRFNPDTGTTITSPGSAGQFWYGRSTVSLQGPFGEVLLGRDYIPAFWIALAQDPFTWNGIAQMGPIHNFAGYNPADTTTTGTTNPGGFIGARNNNSVIYKTPVIAGGLTGQLDVSAGEGGRGQFGRSIGANIEYKTGPIYVGGAWDQTKNNGVGSDPQLLMVAAAYDFGFIKPIVGYSRNRPALGGNTKDMNIGFNVPVLAVGVVHANVMRLDPAGSNNNLTKFGLGYEHNLSKRTSLYADVATAKQQNLTRTTGADFGITHRF
jgi:predicted porin